MRWGLANRLPCVHIQPRTVIDFGQMTVFDGERQRLQLWSACGIRCRFQGGPQENQPSSRGRLQVWLQFHSEDSHPRHNSLILPEQSLIPQNGLETPQYLIESFDNGRMRRSSQS